MENGGFAPNAVVGQIGRKTKANPQEATQSGTSALIFKMAAFRPNSGHARGAGDRLKADERANG